MGSETVPGKKRIASRFFPLEETSLGNRIADDCLCLIQNAPKVIRSPKAFHINLIDVLSTGGTRREPPALRRHFQPAEGCAITGRMRQDGLNLFTRKLFQPNLLRRKFP